MHPQIHTTHMKNYVHNMKMSTQSKMGGSYLRKTCHFQFPSRLSWWVHRNRFWAFKIIIFIWNIIFNGIFSQTSRSYSTIALLEIYAKAIGAMVSEEKTLAMIVG